MKLEDFSYHLPEKLIAQYPLPDRDQSRLMVVHRETGQIEHKVFADLHEYINKGDCVVVNNTRVFPARLIGTKDKTGAKVEVFLLRNLENGIWEVMVKPARKVRLGNKIVFSEDFSCDIIDNTVSGGRIIETHCNGDFFEVLERVGQTPLPPYVKRPAEDLDRESYQTIFASVRGAVAAPTAGRHFTPELVDKIRAKGVNFEEITLHVGLGTFKPVQVDDISRHQMHSEYYEVSNSTAYNITKTREKGGRIFTIGTTTVRALETVADRNGVVRGGKGWTDKYIFPPHQFRAVDGLVTNFHLPLSTLLMMTAAFGGLDLVMEAYKKAVKEKYRFFSYGDAMLVL
ncbi:MAG TPA: tRNA preQ1(34) S-adenosylmethionine ribosyltransferase-isomerase QueA [Calditrichia bacterium]|nr:tRNA preQ1(34) S-adenosylmethionine ribosyltransferase-isomerase QueA [Calditrichota bacterium]HQU70903.1 tRNA preQ1(34) S-adenosylmethionine ribosyltransferase-isomerase QueA [Calditrichia bacterium]HQV32706.1 tRNA preQ1(34) S-adenosylmethionine ribosyltransferase-isomerase QueA [Calditrichia bacterium]